MMSDNPAALSPWKYAYIGHRTQIQHQVNSTPDCQTTLWVAWPRPRPAMVLIADLSTEAEFRFQ